MTLERSLRPARDETFSGPGRGSARIAACAGTEVAFAESSQHLLCQTLRDAGKLSDGALGVDNRGKPRMCDFVVGLEQTPDDRLVQAVIGTMSSEAGARERRRIKPLGGPRLQVVPA